MYKKLAIQTIIYSIGLILPKFINYIFVRFFTFSLKREEFSIYTDMYAISFLIIGLLSFGLENTYFRFLYKKNYNKNIVFSTAMIIQLSIVFSFFIIFINFIKKFISITGYSNHPEYIIMFFLIIFFDTICILPMAWIRINEKPFLYTFINMIVMFIQSFFVVYMFFCYNNYHNLNLENKYYLLNIFNIISSFTDKIGYIFFSNVLSSFINFILIIPIIIQELQFSNFKKSVAKKMINYSFSIMLGTIAFSINENLDKILIKRWGSDEINGSYSACYKIASFMSMYTRMFKLGIEPFFFKKSKEYNAKCYYEDIIYLFILFGLIFYVLTCGNMSWGINILINKKYHTAMHIIPIIMMANLFLGIYTNLSIFYKIIDKPFIGTYISLIGVIITFLFNMIFILLPNNNFIIPAWGTFISYGSMLFVMFFWSKKNFGKIFYKIENILIHFLITITIVYIMNRNSIIELNFVIQLLYLIFIIFFEKKRLLTLIK
ncbi:lipopolysaccharide biosynthesis protein [Blattabacterium cuenoti]|uniref:lipopolysaccharide biosynthesis protein n=1 Tax=Blattabacterium cuenoti TaxID=1653831 RepID=UPI00163BDDD3|nr:oligosaccharide flippase family protein [Blattabacterium cuenoti]